MSGPDDPPPGTSEAASGSGWGAEVVTGEVEGHPCRMYADRRRGVADFLLDGRRWTGRTYLVSGSRRITYDQHERAVERVVVRLVERGVRPGDRVMFLAGNHLEWVVCFWAVLRVGAVVASANAWWNRSEVAGCLDEVDPVLVLTDTDRAGLLPPSTPVLLVEDLRGDVDSAAAGDPADVTAVFEPPDEDRPAMILFTSGTTGAPKGAVLSHRSVIANQQCLLLSRGRSPATLPLDRPGPVSLLAVPLFHIGGVQAIVTALLAGGTLVFAEGRFDAGEVLRLIETERVSIWSCVPTMLHRVLEHPDATRRDLSSIRSLTVTGAPVLPELVTRAQLAMPAARRSVGTVYGGTECGGVITSAAGDDLVSMPGFVGRALPIVELRIDEPDAAGLGEILVRSPAVMSGYWGAPAAEGPVDADGWLHTGDLGRLDDQGRLFVVDRLKDVIIRGGEKVAAPHVEECLRRHPGVADVAVVGLPHGDLGEEVAAVVVPVPGAVLTPAELRGHAERTLARYELPSVWWLRAEPLPVNLSGKVLKRQLRDNWPVREGGAP